LLKRCPNTKRLILVPFIIPWNKYFENSEEEIQEMMSYLASSHCHVKELDLDGLGFYKIEKLFTNPLLASHWQKKVDHEVQRLFN
jgi:hypothetical protein